MTFFLRLIIPTRQRNNENRPPSSFCSVPSLSLSQVCRKIFIYNIFPHIFCFVHIGLETTKCFLNFKKMNRGKLTFKKLRLKIKENQTYIICFVSVSLKIKRKEQAEYTYCIRGNILLLCHFSMFLHCSRPLQYIQRR